MHITLLIYGSLDTVSGGYLYDRKLVEHLRAQGDTVEIISLPWRSYSTHLLDNLAPALYRRLRTLRTDVLIQDELNHPSLFWVNRALRATPYPIVSIVHHLRSSELRPAWQNAFYRWVETRYLRTIDGFIYNSRTTHKIVEALLTVPKPGVVAHPAGDRLPIQTTPDEIRNRLNHRDGLRMLLLGNVTHRKGVHTLLDACQRLEVGNWSLTVVGGLEVEPDYVSAMVDTVQKRGWQDRVTFTGPVMDERLLDIMRKVDVLVMPSSFEGFGIAYLEGMGMGLPAIATTAGAAHEIITHGKDGFLIPPENPTVLAEKLNQLIHTPKRLETMSLAALDRYRAFPNWETSMAAIRSFLVPFTS